MSEKDLVLLSASPNARAGMVVEEDKGVRCIGKTPQKEIKMLTSEGDIRRNVFMKQFLYSPVSLRGIIFPRPFVSQ
jgi:hypothetical protein